MALRDLVQGDCAGPSSVVRLTSHLVRDHGLREEGVSQHSAPSFPQSIDSMPADRLVDEFLEETAAGPSQCTFRMDDILGGIESPDKQRDAAWASQYLASGYHFREDLPDAAWDTALTGIPEQRDSNQFGLDPAWADEYLEYSVRFDDETNQRGSGVSELVKVQESQNPRVESSKFMKYMNHESDELSKQDSIVKNLDEEWTEDFVRSSRLEESELSFGNVSKASESLKETLEPSKLWVEELERENAEEATSAAPSGEIDSENLESIFWKRLQGEWNKISTLNNLVDSHSWIPEYEGYYDPFEEYKFTSENPMKNAPNALEEGKRRLEAGDLPSAVLCFEAAVEKDPENAEIWLILGKTQAENEQDPLAISALKRCLRIDPSNAEALMTLAISYTNESYQNQACLTLNEWLGRNEKYKHLVETPPETRKTGRSSVSTILFNDVHNQVKDSYIKAARLNPSDGIDPDVQSGLGVLFNLSCEYDKAADCFRAALNARPDDPGLWNRYGATLANGQRSEEAVEAYHRALQLSPGFIRARYNLGISCINLGAYREAAEHLLTSLNRQAAGRGVEGTAMQPGAMSDTIWSTLRLVLSLMHKYHLNEAVENRDLETLNEEFETE